MPKCGYSDCNFICLFPQHGSLASAGYAFARMGSEASVVVVVLL